MTVTGKTEDGFDATTHPPNPAAETGHRPASALLQ